jgi:hypothetical protein
MGLLYLFTGGICGLGWIYDLFTLPRQVDEANLRLGFGAGPAAAYAAGVATGAAAAGTWGRPADPYVSPAEMAGYSPEKQVLIISHKIPVLTVRQVVGRTNLEVHEAEQALKNLAEEGHCRELVDAEGRLSYDFS